MGELPSQTKYQKIAAMAGKAGYKVEGIDIKWRTDMIMSDFVRQTEKQIKKILAKENRRVKAGQVKLTVLGFSFGAYISAILSRKIKFEKIYFCSLSPYFKEDFILWPEKDLKKVEKVFGLRMFTDLKKNIFPKNIHTEAFFLVGEKEWAVILKSTPKHYKEWGGKKKLIFIKGVGHNIGHRKCLQALAKII